MRISKQRLDFSSTRCG